MLPVVADIEILLQRLAAEDQILSQLLADLEARQRRFEDTDLPAYERWIRLQLGPALMTLEEVMNQIHERRVLVHRINSLVQNENFHPREALYAAMAHQFSPEPGRVEPEREEAEPSPRSNWDPEEIEARRRAKLESKRAERRDQKTTQKNKKQQKGQEEFSDKIDASSRKKADPIVVLYRTLARKLHPDSPLFLKDLPSTQARSLWHEVQTAYEQGNHDRLLSIATWIGDQNLSPLSLSERFDRIKSMKRSIARLERNIHQSSLHPGWEFRPNRKLLKRAARELEDEIAKTQEVLESLNDFIDSIGPPRERKKPEARGRRH